MTSQQQQLLDAVHGQTIAIYVAAALVFLAVMAVLIVWWIEYRRDPDVQDAERWWRCPWCNGDIHPGEIDAHIDKWHQNIQVGP